MLFLGFSYICMMCIQNFKGIHDTPNHDAPFINCLQCFDKIHRRTLTEKFIGISDMKDMFITNVFFSLARSLDTNVANLVTVCSFHIHFVVVSKWIHLKLTQSIMRLIGCNDASV